MKKILFSFVALGLVLTAKAQMTEKQMATLQHGDKTSVFYGVDALKQAYEAAADTLDVITLSSGEFNVPSYISKSIAIYGVGFERDEETETDPTVLLSNLSLRPTDAVDDDGITIKGGKHVNGCHFEGLRIQGALYIYNNNNVPVNDLTVVKCFVRDGVSYASDLTCYNHTFRQSYMSYIAGSNSTTVYNLLASNCYIYSRVTSLGTSSKVKIDHCIIKTTSSSGPYAYTNSILYYAPQSGAILYNNVIVNNSGTPYQDENGNWWAVKNAGLWAAEDEDGSYAADKDFALKYPARYVGTDGTEIGVRGGIYAWNKIPGIPRITECEIDTKEAANGRIMVSIKAEARTKE